MAVQTTSTPAGFTFLRVAIASQTLALFFQAATAGLLLTSSFGATLHDVGSRVMYGASMLYVLAAILAWRPGGGSPAPCCTHPSSSYSPRCRWSSASPTCRRSMSPWAC